MRNFNRRDVIVGAGVVVAVSSMPALASAGVRRFTFRAGDLVPGWFETATHPGIFESDVEYLIGPPQMISDLDPNFMKNPDHVRSMIETCPLVSYMRPSQPLRPGECMIRYRGANILQNGRLAFRVMRVAGPLTAGVAAGVRSAGPGSYFWLDDGDDLLMGAMPPASAEITKNESAVIDRS